MKDPNDIKIPDIGKKYGKGFKSLFLIFWVLAAVMGAAVAVGLGLARNDWLVFASDMSASVQRTGWYVAAGGAIGGSVILGLYGLLSIFRKRQWLLFLPCLMLAATFPALLYAPHWTAFAFSGGAIVFGIIALKLIDRKATRSAKTPA